MIEVFFTNVQTEVESTELLEVLRKRNPSLKSNFDLEDFNKPFPCGHSILRVVGKTFDPSSIIQLLHSKGYKCQVLEDKVCT